MMAADITQEARKSVEEVVEQPVECVQQVEAKKPLQSFSFLSSLPSTTSLTGESTERQCNIYTQYNYYQTDIIQSTTEIQKRLNHTLKYLKLTTNTNQMQDGGRWDGGET